MQSEKDFLQQYNISDYERPSLTADVASFMIRSQQLDNYRQNAGSRLSLLLIRRGGYPFKDYWALPGGFLQPDETIEQCAAREITEETNVAPVSLMPVGIFSEQGRDPRGWIISAAYVSVFPEGDVRQQAGDDAADARWFDVRFQQTSGKDYVLTLSCGEISVGAVLEEEKKDFGIASFRIKENRSIAFDHAKIIAAALTVLRRRAKNFEVIFDFLPPKFTLSQLQRVQETIMDISVLPANFRRKISDYVIETDEYDRGAGHRPARLYQRRP